jgi:uncharacterized membrane protein
MMELLALLALGLAVAALMRSSSNRTRIDYLERRLRAVLHEIESSKPAPGAEPSAPPAIVDLIPSAAPQPHPIAETVAPPPQPESVPARSLEETLTANWLVWIGALAIALAGTFLVRYAIENGLLRPGARVTLGLLLGIALMAAGEWLRRRPMERAIAAVRANNVPPALTASGLFVAFASVYAAYALYGLLSPLIAFIGLALVALIGVGLSLLQGRLVALMGLLGAFAAPALIATPDPSAWNLFFYLLVVEVACLAVARYRAWWWFALATLAGAAAWPFLWMLGQSWNPADGIPIGLYLLLSIGAFFALRRGMPDPEGRENWIAEVQSFSPPEWVVWVAACAIAFVMFSLANRSNFSAASLTFIAVLSALYVAMGRRHAMFDSFAVVAAVLVVVTAAVMPGPDDAVTGLRHVAGDLATRTHFEVALGVFGVLFGASGFAMLWGAKRPALWAAVSAGPPVLLLLIAYYRFTGLGVDSSWAVLALALAALAGMAVERIERYRLARGLENALVLYAAAAVALLSLAMAMIVREAWLTVALAVQLPALAWIARRIRVRSLEIIAGMVAVSVLVRLVFNYNVFGYPLGAEPALSWTLYGYGVPAAAFFLAARLFRQVDARSELIALLEGGALVFAVLLVSFEIRLAVEGSLTARHYGLLEQSLHSIAWIAVAAALAAYTRRMPNTALFVGALMLFGAAAVQVVFLQLLASNPLTTHEPVGTMPVFNVLFLAYAVPALFAFRFASAISATRFEGLAQLAGGLGFVLVFAWLSLETARAFEGPALDWAHRSDGELYAYSFVWMAYALALLALGIVRALPVLRYASLAVLVVTVLKVFLIDMAGLTGLYRVGSFLGLGLALIGIGYVYQRFVFPRPKAQA